MTKFETMDNMNTNFVALSDTELMEMEGGSIVGAILIVGGAVTVVSGEYFLSELLMVTIKLKLKERVIKVYIL